MKRGERITNRREPSEFLRALISKSDEGYVQSEYLSSGTAQSAMAQIVISRPFTRMRPPEGSSFWSVFRAHRPVVFLGKYRSLSSEICFSHAYNLDLPIIAVRWGLPHISVGWDRITQA
jgi:hypothetical protein